MNPTLETSYQPVHHYIVYLTEDCNLRCDTYCFVEKKPRRMTAETAQKTVDYLLNRDISGALRDVTLTFFGGEPFLELDRMEQIVGLATERRPNCNKRVHFAATTNGTVASPRVERLLRKAHMDLLVSLDGGPKASAYRPFVSGRSSYELVARNLPKLTSWARSLSVRMTYHPGALDLVENVRHAFHLGAPSVALAPVVEADWRGLEERVEYEFDRLAEWYLEEAHQGQIPALTLTNTLLQKLHAASQGAPRPARPCGVAKSLLGIDPDGHVMPCHRFLYRPKDWLGTVDQSGLSAQREPFLHLSSAALLGCDDCIARPVCGGSCPLVTLSRGLRLDQPHPSYCMLTRAHVRAAQHIHDTLSAEGHVGYRRMLASPQHLHPAITEISTR
jgi:uncharacterized protein